MTVPAFLTKSCLPMVVLAVCLLASAEQAEAQVVYMPSTVYYATPTVQAVPQVTYFAPAAPVTTNVVPTTTTFYAPAPVARTTFFVPTTTVVPTTVLRPAVVGRGIVGQPKLYVPGQPLRNALRFVTP